MTRLPFRRRRHEVPRQEKNTKSRSRGADDHSDCGCDDACDVCQLLDLFNLFSSLPAALAMLALVLVRRPEPRADTPRGLAGWMWQRVRNYQDLISVRRPAVCPMTPTCSHYGLEALRRYGAIRGAWMTARRLRRCGHTDLTVDPVV